MYFLCKKTDNTQFRIIKRYFASMLRRLEFTFPEGAISISRADQKLLTPDEMVHFDAMLSKSREKYIVVWPRLWKFSRLPNEILNNIKYALK